MRTGGPTRSSAYVQAETSNTDALQRVRSFRRASARIAHDRRAQVHPDGKGLSVHRVSVRAASASPFLPHLVRTYIPTK